MRRPLAAMTAGVGAVGRRRGRGRGRMQEQSMQEQSVQQQRERERKRVYPFLVSLLVTTRLHAWRASSPHAHPVLLVVASCWMRRAAEIAASLAATDGRCSRRPQRDRRSKLAFWAASSGPGMAFAATWDSLGVPREKRAAGISPVWGWGVGDQGSVYTVCIRMHRRDTTRSFISLARLCVGVYVYVIVAVFCVN
ncbi:hypothetical protein K504DRAFT_491972 [Pleomassaria siparia CBS 279.74]|uniref:Uncharacterized protein n=1 Tax=Pleomassaria siparia CBS 279.74 TaxID=1314801 RepID=A0A6G1K5Y3_9PLEO|nr:hypothetical protein K504DRAFT_491972 [Pleomassaria siparia CBS 279.74]